MKLDDAMTKVQTVVDRLDAGDVVDPTIKPLRLYLFGSVLSGKTKPNDVDLLMMYETTDDYNADEVYNWYVYKEPHAEERTSRALRKGMKMVRVHMHKYNENQFPAGPYELLWERDN
jgi:hypothetical protein